MTLLNAKNSGKIPPRTLDIPTILPDCPIPRYTNTHRQESPLHLLPGMRSGGLRRFPESTHRGTDPPNWIDESLKSRRKISCVTQIACKSVNQIFDSEPSCSEDLKIANRLNSSHKN
jgi:hypothetical protein